MKSYFAYIRVSTVKQGEHGSSLNEQRDAIVAFATRHDLNIVGWFEERETAAKIGRREFTRMLTALQKRKADGVIFHKIDRSARNLKDWSIVQDLAEQGIDVRFTQESVNLGSNEGRLTGDFLAVISAHYIRNLREEVKKGIRGRLKQGLYPLPAPIGYLDQGGGKPKVPDPVRAPYVRMAFDLYGSGQFALHGLADELYERGFRGRSYKKVGFNRMAEMLRNPFYIGVIRMKRSGESYLGVHEPLVTTALFERVQMRLDGKMNAKVAVHDFQFRRMIACGQCGYRVIGESQKGHVYYRCHACIGQSIREEAVQTAIEASLVRISLAEDEVEEVRQLASVHTVDWAAERQNLLRAASIQLDNVKDRLGRLMDIYLDGEVDRKLFEEKKLTLLLKQKSLEEERSRIQSGEQTTAQNIDGYLELVKTLSLSYGLANTNEKRILLKTITSNLSLHEKNIVVELRSPFRELSQLDLVRSGAPVRGKPRTRAMKIFKLLASHCTANNEE